mmetsp:Transcript_4244/g.7650  ORF Transcript_4244/g.7650 Transcript_4244/m.7650 type:complete len:314 (+) Transcript_4244:2-943(+)
MADISAVIEEAQALEAAGQLKDAAKAFGAAVSAQGDVLLKALAALSFVRVSLQQDQWPSLNGMKPDELMSDILAKAEAAPVRSRLLEGQLLRAWSQALFAKPGQDAAAIDRAIEIRNQAGDKIVEGTVEALDWKRSKAEVAAATARANEVDRRPLHKEQLLQRLRKFGARAEDADYVSELFEVWAFEGADGEVLSVSDFLEHYLEVVRRLPGKQCGAPCEGGLPPGSSPLERELVRLVSRDGAGDWSTKADSMRSSFPEVSAESLEAIWHDLAPKIKKVVESDEPMACGHNCSTCPTKNDCKVHDAIKDIEDL